MSEAELQVLRSAIEKCREAIVGVLPFDETALPDTTFEMGFILQKLADLDFLLQRDQRAKAASF